MRVRSVMIVALTGSIAGVASAQDYGDRVSDAVKESSEASVVLSGFSGGSWHAMNSLGYIGVPKSVDPFSPVYYDVGETPAERVQDRDTVEVAWWESIIPAGRYVNFVMRTEEGHEFVPFGTDFAGSPVLAYSLELGGDGDGVDWRAWIDAVYVEEVTTSYSIDGGQTVYSDPTIFDPFGGLSWDGTDDSHLGLALPGDGVNWIQVSYKINPVPAPGVGMALAVFGGLAAARRRR